MPLGGGIAGWVAQHHRPLLLNSPEDVEEFLPERHPDRNISSAISVPLLVLTALNVVGVRSGVRAAMFRVVSKLVPLVMFVVFGVFFVSFDTIAGQPAGDVIEDHHRPID